MVGPHSPEAKIRHEFRPALATTVRPVLATRTKWAKTCGWRQALGRLGEQTARYSSASSASIRIVPTRSGRSVAGSVRSVSHSHSKSRQSCGLARVDLAAAGGDAVLARRAGGLVELGNFQRRAAHRARAAALAGSRGQIVEPHRAPATIRRDADIPHSMILPSRSMARPAPVRPAGGRRRNRASRRWSARRWADRARRRGSATRAAADRRG